MKRFISFLIVFVTYAGGLVFAADPIEPNLSDLRGSWTGKITYDGGCGPQAATMTIYDNNVKIIFNTKVSGDIAIKGKDLTISGTSSQGEYSEFNLKCFNEAGKTIVKGTFYIKGKRIKETWTGSASFKKDVC